MAHFSYSFCMSMLHSLWQAGLLVLIYLFTDKILKHNATPLQKRNGLFILLTTQVVLFIITFLIYFLNIENTVAEKLLGETVAGFVSQGIIGSAAPWLFSIYLIAITYKMIKALYEWLHFKKLHNAGLQKPSIDLKLFTLLKADHFGIKRKVQLWFITTDNAPVTFGFFKPVIVLPVALVNHLSMQQAETLILHELTHIKANDYLLNWALIIVENIFFFNPFVITLCKKIRLEREKYCDSNVIAFQYSPLLYAETLLKAQHVQQFIPQYQLAAVTGKKQLLQRIQFFTAKNNFAGKKRKGLFIPVFASLFMFVLGATLFFQYQVTLRSKPIEAVVVNTEENNALTETAIPKFVNNIIENLTDENLKKIETAVEKQKPVIEKQLKKLEPFIKSIQDNAEQIAQQFDANYITPVSLKESDPVVTTRQIIVKEEQSGSKNTALKIYTVSYIDGKWVVVPEWMLSAKEITDTLRNKILDSSAPIQQKEQE